MIRSQQLRCPHGLAARSTLSLACALLLAAGGCADPELDTLYGRQRLPLGWASVNGTDVLAEMFAEARHEVTSRRTLITSDMQSVDAIVWFPDDFHAPDEGICRWLDRWLAARAGRTLIYVGRDFDAAPLYWRTMAPKVAPQQQPAYRARAAEAAAHAYHSYKDDDEQLECDWFKIKSDDKREAEKLGGPWSKDIQSSKTQIELGAKLASTAVRRRLLTAADDVLVARRQLSGGNQSQLILIANGSFLLNLPLVNHEHRKLAGKLIETVGPPGRVVFLESGEGGPPIDPPPADNSLWKTFGAWPLNAILLHFAVLGIIFCFARWPIFGRPKDPAAEPVTDFAKHVEAIGDLLRRTKNRTYAMSKLAEIERGGGSRSSPP